MQLDSKTLKHQKKVCYLSTYPPKQCGIAVFTKDLVDNLDDTGEFAQATVMAVKKWDATERYGSELTWQIAKDREEDYFQAAIQINASDVDVVNIQHEFGIFGGEFGNYILSFLENVKKPVVTSLHTVQPDFEPKALRVLKEIVFYSAAVVVTGRTAANILTGYGFPSEKIKVIQHGCPNVPFIASDTVKPSLNLAGRTVLCTFGLLSPGKGVEYAIQALPSIVERHPDAL